MVTDILKKRTRWESVIVGALCTIPSVIMCVIVSRTNEYVGLAFLGIVLFCYVLLIVFNNYRDGFLLLTAYAFFMFQLFRIVRPTIDKVPMGVGVEILLLLLLVSIVVQNSKVKSEDKELHKNPITYALMIYVGFSLLMLLNPLSRAVMGRVMALREISAFAISFIVALHVFKTRKFIDRYLHFWILFALLAALYGIYQEMFGLQDWELAWLYSQPDEGKLAIVWGHIRKWSFLSDINSFGLLMAYGSIICMILALGPYTPGKKIYYAICSALMMTSMTFSGTRTAMAMVVFGLVFFVVMTLNSARSIMIIVGFAVGVLALFFGPFYGPNFNRLRSTFDVNKDASMNVRDQTRARVQPYVRSHPFGGGFYTSGALGLRYDPSHPLAGKWDPDSGYLRTALERGWIGLLVQLGFYATILIVGLKFYFRCSDPADATLCCAYLCGFFALSVANYAQDSLEQKPINLIVMASVASIINLIALEKKKTNLK
ncbi:MAG TPA: O-antigen ligase family protein [Cyclobacteriaceae bacterium]|jgi:hypothetical protein|nr:O-antigen ligase family protein [Cyclobacteriaceae bacterium]